MIYNPYFSKKVSIFSIIAIINFALLLRYLKIIELSGGEYGSDSWAYHNMIDQIRNEGQIIWMIDILSIFGYYPPYEELGAISLYTSSTLILGTNTSMTILLMANSLSIITSLICFILTHHLFRNKLFSTLCFFIIITANGNVIESAWIIHTRGLFGLLFVFSIYLFYNSLSESDNRSKYISLFLFQLPIVSSIHRTSILIPLFLLLFAFFYLSLGSILPKSTEYIDRSQFKKYLGNKSGSNFVLFLMIFGFSFTYLSGVQNFSFTSNFYGSIFNQFMSYAVWVGLPLVFSIFGFFNLSRLNFRIKANLFLLTYFLILLILSFDPAYLFRLFIYPLIICVTLGIMFILNEVKANKIFTTSLLLSIIIMAISPFFLTVQVTGGLEGANSEDIMSSGLFYRDSKIENDDTNPLVLNGFGTRYNIFMTYSEIRLINHQTIEDIEATLLPGVNLTWFLNTRETFNRLSLSSIQTDIYENSYDFSFFQLKLNSHSSCVMVVNNNYGSEKGDSYTENEILKMRTTPLIDSIMKDYYVLYNSENISLYMVK